MRLKVTLSRPNGSTSDVVITADSTVTIGEIAAAIAARDPQGGAPAGIAGIRVIRGGAERVLSTASTLSDARIASGSVVSLIAADDRSGSAQQATVGRLRVVAGPDAGREFPLSSGGPFVIGRDASCDVVLSDPLVSKRHARIEVDRGVEFIDLNSANGIVVDDVPVTRARLDHGRTVQLGDTTIRVDIVAAPIPPSDVDLVEYLRAPRVEPRYAGQEFEGPDIPNQHEPIPFPWVALVAPAIMGIAFIFTPGIGPLRFVFIALAPLIMIGTFVSQIVARRRKHQAEVQRFEEQLAYLQEQLAVETILERAVRNAEAPETRQARDAAARHDRLLWTRRPEHWTFLTLRLGTGRAPSRNTVESANSSRGLPDFQRRFAAVVETYREIDDVPIVEGFRSAGAIGVAGPQAPAVARSLVAQLAALHAPADLAIASIAGPTSVAEFDWIKWLPHSSSPNSPLPPLLLSDSEVTGAQALVALEELIAARGVHEDADRGPEPLTASVMLTGSKVDVEQLTEGEPMARPAVLVVVCADAPVDRGRLVHVAERAAEAGVFILWVAPRADDLPALCRTFVETDPTEPSGTVGFVRLGASYRAWLETMSVSEGEQFARGLSAVVDVGSFVEDESDLPGSVSLTALVGEDLFEAGDAVVDRWRQNDSIHDRTPDAPLRPRRAGRLRAIVGQAAVDAMHLDLRAQGPHALVGGTTGSGKSEFLQAWVLGMAAEYSPDRVTFLLIDYKGGSAFAECVNLPHCIGLVTDLSPHLVRRALTSLRAELHHRERLFAAKRVKDLVELEKRGDPDCPPALVIVIDEFAALVGEVPAFVDGVVDVAQRGRSLGIHLIMATQRPAGVIRDNLRANTNLRVALRVADTQDSMDVVNSPLAAGFDPALPGRAAVRTGPGRLETFQSGYAGGWTSTAPGAPDVRIATLGFGVSAEWATDDEAADVASTDDLGPNDATRLVQSIIAGSRLAAVPAPRRPWLDELAATYDLAKLHQRTDQELVLGVGDDPAHQAQDIQYFRPDVDGNIAFFGTGGSGKSTALRTLAAAAAVTPRGGPVQVYGIDFSAGGLRMLETLPHVGSIVAGDDQERIVRLMKMVRATIDERVDAFAAVNAGSLPDYRRLAKSPDEPRLLLLIDGMATFRQEYEFTGLAGVFPMFQQILADGRQVGVHVAISADRPGSVSPSVAGSIQRRIALRMPEENDYISLDVPADVIGPSSPAGRAIFDGNELQIAVFGGSTSTVDQAMALASLAESMRARGVAQAPPVRSLPTEIELSDLGPVESGRVAIGMLDETLGTVSIEPRGTFVIAGPPQSGRSTALRTAVESLRRALPGAKLHYIGNARSALGGLDGWAATAFDPESASTLAKKLLPAVAKAPGDSPIVVVIETVGDFVGTPADADLLALVKAIRRNDHFALVEAETSSLVPSWPLLVEVKAARRGLALQPDPQEGEVVFRTPFPRVRRSEFPAGRGFLVESGRVRRLQVART